MIKIVQWDVGIQNTDMTNCGSEGAYNIYTKHVYYLVLY